MMMMMMLEVTKTLHKVYLLMCLKDEAPHLVNPLVESFVTRHATPPASVSAASLYSSN